MVSSPPLREDEDTESLVRRPFDALTRATVGGIMPSSLVVPPSRSSGVACVPFTGPSQASTSPFVIAASVTGVSLGRRGCVGAELSIETALVVEGSICVPMKVVSVVDGIEIGFSSASSLEGPLQPASTKPGMEE